MKKIVAVLLVLFLFALTAVGKVPDIQAAEEKARESLPDSFLMVGGWVNPDHESKTSGVWFNQKYLNWCTKSEKPIESFAIGVTMRGNYGASNRIDIDWGYLAPGPRVGYYRDLGEQSSVEADAALLYRFDKDRKSGPMGDIHAEFDYWVNHGDRLIFQVDSDLFSGNSWVGSGLYWEHALGDYYKITGGTNVNWNYLDRDTFTGIQPILTVKYNDCLSLGVTANFFTGQGTPVGAVVSYAFAQDISSRRHALNRKADIFPSQPIMQAAGIVTSGGGMRTSEHLKLTDRVGVLSTAPAVRPAVSVADEVMSTAKAELAEFQKQVKPETAAPPVAKPEPCKVTMTGQEERITVLGNIVSSYWNVKVELKIDSRKGREVIVTGKGGTESVMISNKLLNQLKKVAKNPDESWLSLCKEQAPQIRKAIGDCR